MGRGDVHWNEMADGRFECATAVNCDDLAELSDRGWGLTQTSLMRIGGFK